MSLLEIKDKVQRYLIDMGLHGIEITQEGYSFRMGSTRVFLDFDELGEGDQHLTILRIVAPIVNDVKPTAELYEYVALHGDDWLFGHLGLLRSENDEHMQLALTHRLLVDYLDPQELRTAVGAVAVTGDEIDDELAARFGGTVFESD